MSSKIGSAVVPHDAGSQTLIMLYPQRALVGGAFSPRSRAAREGGTFGPLEERSPTDIPVHRMRTAGVGHGGRVGAQAGI